jgi:multidrug efflux system membrane fusion protein
MLRNPPCDETLPPQHFCPHQPDPNALLNAPPLHPMSRNHALIFLLACGGSGLVFQPLHAAGATASPPATLTKENELTLLILKPEAERALRLKTAPVERRKVPNSRLFSGEIVTPLATEAATVAPLLGGTLEEVLRLADLQATADGRVTQAQVQIDGARIAVERAQKMLVAEAGSVRNLDEAKTALALAEGALATARAQRNLLGTPVGRGGGNRTWVRVAIYSGEAPLLDANAPAGVRTLQAGATPLAAKPVSGPPTANALTSTLDWYYELPGDHTLRPGQRVAVEIPTSAGSRELPVIPHSALLRDIHGGEWVYVQTAGNSYKRHRVQVARIAGAEAVLENGPAAGTQIVTQGAAELFGTEFVTGK